MPLSAAVLKQGLVAMGEAYRAKVDASTESLWKAVCGELSDAQFRHGVATQLKTPEKFMPPPGVVLAYAYDMPRENDTRPLPKLALPPVDAAETGRLLCVVRDNPISESERNGGADGAMHYVRRLAVAANLITADGHPVKPMPKGNQ
jgi:hypothetical protein